MLIIHGNKQEQIVQKPTTHKKAKGFISHTPTVRTTVITPIVTPPTPIPPPVEPTPPIVVSPVKDAPRINPRRQKQTHKPATRLEQGVLIHDNRSMSPDINKTRTFHFDPDVPHVIHDRNILEKNYKETVFAPVSVGTDNDAVLTHTTVINKEIYLEVTNPHVGYNDPQSVADLDKMFDSNVISIIEAILKVGAIDFEQFDVEFAHPHFMIVSGVDGMAAATTTTPFVLSTTKSVGISYLMNAMFARFKIMGMDEDKLIEVLIDMLKHSSGVNAWLGQIVELWNAVENQ